MMHYIQKHIRSASQAKIVSILFLFFTTLSLLILLSSPNLLSSNDPLHLLHHAESIWNGEAANLPLLSTLREMQLTPWHAFHLILAPFVGLSENFEVFNLITYAKFAHAILLGAFFGSFYFLFQAFLNNIVQSINSKSIRIYSIVLTILLFAISPYFTTRLFLLRPHLLAIPFIAFAALLIIKKRWLALFLLSAIFPFIYSASFLLLIPLVAYTLTKGIYHWFGQEQNNMLSALLAGVSGLTLGITLHPDTLGYLYNAYFVHLSSIAARFVSSIPVGAELFTPSLSSTEWLWLVPLVAAVSLYWVRIYDEKQIPETLHLEKAFVLVLSTCYLLLFVAVGRAIEYTLPFGLVFLGVFFADDVVPTFKRIIRIPKKLDSDFPGIARTIRNFRDDFNKNDRLFIKKALAAFVAIMLTSTAFSIGLQQYKAAPPDSYKKAAQYIQKHSSSDELVFHSDWSDYSQLVFYNDKNTYIMGMDPLFTYWYDKEKYWLWYHLTYSKYVCAQSTCNADNNRNTYNVLKNTFNASYILTKADTPGATDEDYTLLDKIQKSDGFDKVFSDNFDDQEIYLFKIKK